MNSWNNQLHCLMKTAKSCFRLCIRFHSKTQRLAGSIPLPAERLPVGGDGFCGVLAYGFPIVSLKRRAPAVVLARRLLSTPACVARLAQHYLWGCTSLNRLHALAGSSNGSWTYHPPLYEPLQTGSTALRDFKLQDLGKAFWLVAYVDWQHVWIYSSLANRQTNAVDTIEHSELLKAFIQQGVPHSCLAWRASPLPDFARNKLGQCKTARASTNASNNVMSLK